MTEKASIVLLIIGDMEMRRAVLISRSLENQIKYKEMNNLNRKNHYYQFSRFTQHMPKFQQVIMQR